MGYLQGMFSGIRESGKYVGSSLLEFFITIFFSCVPLLAGAYSIYSDSAKTNQLSAAFAQEVGNGEIYLISVTLMASVAYSVIKDPPVRFKSIFFIYCMALFLVAVVSKILMHTTQLQADAIRLSYWVGGGTAVVLYFNMFFNHKALYVEAPSLQRKQTSEFKDGFDSYMEGVNE